MARNRNRQAGPILRTIATPTPRPTAPSQNLGARAQTVVTTPRVEPVRRARRAKMTGAQRDSEGRRSDWNRPATLNPWTTPMTTAWDYSATTMPRGGVHPTVGSRDLPYFPEYR